MRPIAAGAPLQTIALIGDSHATHWRAAVDVVALAKGQAAVSIARSRCPFSDAVVVMARRDRLGCRGWNHDVVRYLRRHREITTLLVSNRSSARYVRAPGASNFETQVAGHIALWRALPATIRRIVVIRDPPRNSAAATLCVQRAFAAGREAGALCARPRAAALHPDPAVEAARRMRSARVHAIDLSPFFCDPRRCFAVIGGAYAYKDYDHITAVFARTLGPFLLRAFDAILRRESTPPGPFDGLLADERAAAQCVIGERLAAAAAGGWEQLGPDHLERAGACRAMLEQRAAQLRALGLGRERDRRRRYAVIVAVLDVRRPGRS